MDLMAVNDVTIRALARDDLDDVVAIDAIAEQRSRRAYFERRLAAALGAPGAHAQFAACDDQGLAGYILARELRGEFGRNESIYRLEAVGIRPDAKRHYAGTLLLETLVGHGRRHGVSQILTQAAWTHHAMLQWLDATGFELAGNHVVDCGIGGGQYVPARDDPPTSERDESASREIDYGDPHSGNDFERLARDVADVHAMPWGDLDAVVRIDRAITGRDRRDYLQRQLREAMEDSAVRVSLCAHRDGIVVGYLMARADLGDFGRVEPVAVIDTIGVDPAYAHRGIGRALLSQLFVNLGALRIERVETVLAPRDFALLAFLYDVGFGPSQRLAFVRPIER